MSRNAFSCPACANAGLPGDIEGKRLNDIESTRSAMSKVRVEGKDLARPFSSIVS